MVSGQGNCKGRANVVVIIIIVVVVVVVVLAAVVVVIVAFCYLVGGLSRLTLCKVVSRGRAHGDSAYKLVRASSWKSSHPGKHMGIPN